MSTENPQVARTKTAVLDAARELLASEGPQSVTHLRVAERARVGRATIYRHWPDRVDLLLDLLRGGAKMPLLDPPPEGPIEDRLLAVLSMLPPDRSEGVWQTMSYVIWQSRNDERWREVKSLLSGQGPAELITMLFRQAADAGEISPDVDADLLAEQLLGPIFLRRLFLERPTDRSYLHRLVSQTVSHLRV